MARVNITVPDHLLDRARAAGLNVSRIASAGLADELDRRGRITELDVYLRELETEQGPTSAADRVAACEWADQLPGQGSTRRDATRPA